MEFQLQAAIKFDPQTGRTQFTRRILLFPLRQPTACRLLYQHPFRALQNGPHLGNAGLEVAPFVRTVWRPD
jgi:hypothetical protein